MVILETVLSKLASTLWKFNDSKLRFQWLNMVVKTDFTTMSTHFWRLDWSSLMIFWGGLAMKIVKKWLWQSGAWKQKWTAIFCMDDRTLKYLETVQLHSTYRQLDSIICKVGILYHILVKCQKKLVATRFGQTILEFRFSHVPPALEIFSQNVWTGIF